LELFIIIYLYKIGIVDLLLESYKTLKWFFEKKINSFNIKIFDELLSLLNLKNEEDFVSHVFLIFGERSRIETNSNELKDSYLNVANHTINYKEFISTLAFYRIENVHDKLNCKILH